MVGRFNGRLEGAQQSQHVRSGEGRETTLHRCAWLYNHPLAQLAFGSKTPLHAMKKWHERKPELLTKQLY
jgi:hypothetical protein|tara:strand:- start:51 stop:260 length:210 start_codon:yes stop_codon:yes gene_type:complete